MEIYQQLHSVLTVNDRKFLVDLKGWADKRLDHERYNQFKLDFEEILSFYNSVAVIEKIYSSTALYPYGTPLWIGFKYTHQNSRPYNEKYEYWSNQFANDPAVQYNPEIRIQ